MRWGNLDWNSGRHFVRETLSRARYDYPGGFTSPKTEGSAQSVDLTPAYLEALREYHKRQAEERLQAGKDYQDQDLVFATPKGTPFDQKTSFTGSSARPWRRPACGASAFTTCATPALRC